jgi:hypothetical protein
MAMQLLMLDTNIVIHYFKGHAGGGDAQPRRHPLRGQDR